MAKISKREKKDSTKKFKFLKGLGGGLLIGLLVGAIGLFAFEKYDPPDESKGVSPATVFERIVAQDEMVSASQSYVITDRVVDKNRFFDLFDIPFTENSFWYRYSGVLKAGVNLQDARINTSGSTITITLAQPYVISNEPDMEKSGVLEEKNNILNPIHIEDIDAFLAECEARSRQEAIEDGLLEEAKTNAERNLRDIFYVALGDEYTVNIQWK